MAKHGKKYLAAAAKVDENRAYPPKYLIRLLANNESTFVMLSDGTRIRHYHARGRFKCYLVVQNCVLNTNKAMGSHYL